MASAAYLRWKAANQSAGNEDISKVIGWNNVKEMVGMCAVKGMNGYECYDG